MECPKCKFENLEGSNFCGSCGSSMRIKITCSKCKAENPDDYSFCNNCGHDLSKSPDTSEINYKEPQSYTPKHLADKILTTRSSIEGERKFVTVLFADVANFTSMSERLDPEEVHQIMDGCFKILMDEIHKYEGTINQFTGDGVMALFGAPVAHEDHAQRACYAAIKIQGALENYNNDLESRFDTQFKMRIGINSGLVVVGSIGDDLRMDYTAVGDTTNLAAHMESAATPGTILLSEKTQKLAKDFFELESIGEIEIKGKDKLQKAFQLIKTGDVGTRIGASVAKGLTRFVGRKNSMNTLTEAFKKIKSDSGQIVGIVGEAGVGKSRLLLEMRNLLPPDEFEYLEGRCLQYGGSILYLPILDILRSIFNIKDDDKEFSIKRKINDIIINLDDQFSSLNLSFQDVLSLKIDDEDYLKLEPKEKRDKIFEAIRNLLIRMSQEKPLVIAVEDLHWIDKTSEEFLNYFIDWLANTPILLILLYRPEYTHQWGSKSFHSKIGVDQLGMSSSGELVKAILEEGDVAPELRQLILSRSAGNPLFMEEFTHTLVENGSIEKREDQYALKGNPEDIKVPDTIQGIIAARLDRLEDNLKRTMQVASVIGRDFAFKILQTITGMRNELKSNLLNLQGLEFIYEKSLFPELEYIFKHALTQEVAYNSLLQKRRNEIHGKIGSAIEELYPERMEEFYEMLAYHYCRSDDAHKAIQYSKLAGKKAFNNYSHWDAYYFYKAAYDILCKQTDNKESKIKRRKTITQMLNSVSILGLPDAILEMYEEAIKICKELEDRKTLSKFYLQLSNYYSHRGKPKLSIKYAKDAFEEAVSNQDLDLMVHSSWSLSIAYSATGEHIKIIAIVPKVIEMLEESGKQSKFFSFLITPYSLLSLYCGLAMGITGNFREGEKYLKKGLAHAYINDSLLIGSFHQVYGCINIAKGDWNDASEQFEKGIKQCRKVHYTWVEGLCLCGKSYAKHKLQDNKNAMDDAKNGLKIHIESGVKMFLSFSYLCSGLTHFESGDLNSAKHFLEKGLEVSQKHNEKEMEGRILIEFGRVVRGLKLNYSNKAKEYIAKGIHILQELEMKPFIAVGHVYQGELYLETNEPEKAIKNLKIAERMFQEMGIEFWLNKTQGLLSLI